MLSQGELTLWCERVRLSTAARLVIDSIRSAEPARRVQAGRSNVCGRYPSQKMGVTIQFESHRVELAGIYEMEHDADVLEYYDQPPQLETRLPECERKTFDSSPHAGFFCSAHGECWLGRMEDGRGTAPAGGA